ncbi:unnamed protein product [Amoebophrya sp. A120]|nr:unnamed protein product [Amoebophrya sp. A120]|eukprot:GSA120T00018681001.1
MGVAKTIFSAGRTSSNIKCKSVWVWKNAICHAKSEACKNLCCMITKSRPVLTKSGSSFSCRIGMGKIAQNLSCCVLHSRPHGSWKFCMTNRAFFQTQTFLHLISNS